MKVISKMINLMEMEYIIIIIMKDMKDNGVMDYVMEMELIILIMEIKLLVNLIKIKPLEAILEIVLMDNSKPFYIKTK